jgi:hypothetical protein
MINVDKQFVLFVKSGCIPSDWRKYELLLRERYGPTKDDSDTEVFFRASWVLELLKGVLFLVTHCSIFHRGRS